MKANLKNPLLRATLIAGLACLLPGRTPAQELNELFTFPMIGPGDLLNSEGTGPTAGLVLANGTLYGLTAAGGAAAGGTVFSLSTNGAAFTDLYDFSDRRYNDKNFGLPSGLSSGLIYSGSSLGIFPKFGLVLSGDMLYGTTFYGGSYSNGMVFCIQTNGSGFRTLYEFSGGGDGAHPSGALLLSGNTLYGTTAGGDTVNGTIFSINTNGDDFAVLHAFPNNDFSGGASPLGGVILSPSGTTLYGTTSDGGAWTHGGTVFSLNTDGSDFTVLYSFSVSAAPSDGCSPVAGLVLSTNDNTLYGATCVGGAYNLGTIFAMNTDGSGFNTLHHMSPNGAPVDQAVVVSPLLLSGNGQMLYGSAIVDLVPFIGVGVSAGGSAFALTTDGLIFELVHAFATAKGDGAIPDTFMRSGKTLYGATAIGGTGGGGGTVFTIPLGLAARISVSPSSAQLDDTIKVVVTVLNTDWETINNVRLNTPFTVNVLSGTNAVSPAGFSGPTMTPALAPLATTSFTYLFTVTNYGKVTFTIAATGLGAEGAVVTSLSVTSAPVTIAPQADLMVKTSDPQDTTFGGAGEFQQPPPFNDQDVTLSVSSNGTAAYIVRLQNDESVAKSYVLRCTTNNIANWAVTILAGNNNIFGAFLSAQGWTTPELDPSGYLDLPVSLAPLPTATVSDNKWVQITVLADSATTNVVDAVRLHATLVPVPVKVTINKVGPQGYTSDSIQQGLTDINAPLVPATDPGVLANNLTLIHCGLVADGVTPLVIKLEANPDDLGEFPEGKDFVFSASYPAGGNLLANASLGQRFQVLTDGAWLSTNHVLLSASSPIVYVQLQPILSDDLVMLDQPPGVFVDFTVQDTAGAVGIQAGDVQFALQKPPIALVHGYATPGDWGADFKAILSNSRPVAPTGANGQLNTPNNFILTVKYGQDILSGLRGIILEYTGLPIPAYENTVASLQDCAQMLNQSLFSAMTVLRANWAFTRFDVVGHSQGGVLARMLCSGSVAPSIPTPFRNDANCNRGRFHRVVTIGSPHNGSRLLHYMLDMKNQWIQRLGVWNPVGMLGVLSLYAQPKFDPFLEQIKGINDPAGPWLPDPGASFHLVRTVTDGGVAPDEFDLTPSYIALGLNTDLGGLGVIPRGSDGVVDFDSMGANVPPAPLAANVFTVPPNNFIAHAAPLLLFGADDNQTASTVVAQHVIGALDQVLLNPNDMVFGPFPLPPLLSTNVEAVIDSYAATGQFATLKAGPSMLAHPLDDYASYQYQIPFPSNLPAVGDVTWFVQVYDSAGISDDGVELTPSGTNNSSVTVSVDNALVGDVVLSAVYRSVSNTVVLVPPTLVVSMQPAGVKLTGFQLLPATIALPVGTVVSPQLMATYSDGSSSLRYAVPGTVTAVSSQASVVSVDDPLNWQLSAVGTAQINVNWSGFTAASQITVFDPTSNVPPTLSLLNTGNGQLTAAWAGFTTGYVLESSGDLQPTNSWQPVAMAPISGGGWTTVPLAATNTSQFYRLRWDPSAINF